MRDHRRLRGKARSVKRKTELRLKEASWPSRARRATHSELSAVYAPPDPLTLSLRFFFFSCQGVVVQTRCWHQIQSTQKKSNPNMFAGTFLCKICTDG